MLSLIVVLWMLKWCLLHTQADVNRAFVSYFLGLESVTMAKTSKGSKCIDRSMPNQVSKLNFFFLFFRLCTQRLC